MEQSLSKHLRDLIREGRLFDFQKWIDSRKPLRFSEDDGEPVTLSDVVQTGFHSMVETALKAENWTRKRNEVERLFRRLKGFRCIFSRFDKLDVMFTGFIHFGLIVEALS